MTEIPEHLLKRSRERRAAIGGEGAPAEEAPAAADEPAGETAGETASPAPVPAAAAAAVPAEPTPEPPKPVRPEVAAALRRKKIPYWALPVVFAVPLWAYVYQATLEPAPAAEATPFELGQEIYARCAACHGADGSGVSAPVDFAGVLQTWPDFRDHMAWVRSGSAGWPGTTYGAPGKPKRGGMPAFADLTDAELAQVVLYEREAFGGMEEGDPEYEALFSIANGETTFEDSGLGPVAQEDGVDPSVTAGG